MSLFLRYLLSFNYESEIWATWNVHFFNSIVSASVCLLVFLNSSSLSFILLIFQTCSSFALDIIWASFLYLLLSSFPLGSRLLNLPELIINSFFFFAPGCYCGWCLHDTCRIINQISLVGFSFCFNRKLTFIFDVDERTRLFCLAFCDMTLKICVILSRTTFSCYKMARWQILPIFFQNLFCIRLKSIYDSSWYFPFLTVVIIFSYKEMSYC